MLASLLALPTAARADEVLNPPGGPVLVEADYQQPDQQQRHKNRELKRALMLQFDRDGDGRLGPRERMQAVRVLERVQRKLAGRDGQPRQQGQQQRRRFIQRFDTNGDGNVDRSEMPPGAARKLRRLDRDHDGWVEPNEVR
ncbi:MAG: EF-hand domain-containing protein [Myxococcota bacterium]|nr:EF-hand domain-containing protein [Myxococcota bacterium]